MTTVLSTEVLIIGGGVTGTALARDLSLRSVPCLLVEKGDINAGASGANHGLLHSGARYVGNDPEAAAECSRESSILKGIAPHCIEETGGVFVALPQDDEAYLNDFPTLCSNSNIKAEPISISELRELEPALSGDITAAYLVADASVDPFRLSLEMMQDAVARGVPYLPGHRVTAFKWGLSGQQTRLLNETTQQTLLVDSSLVVNATGAWAADVAALAGIRLDMVYSKGSLAVTYNRICSRVINRLRPPSDADIIVPGGTVSVLGTTSVKVESPEETRPTAGEVDYIIDECSAMVPSLSNRRLIRAYAGIRPLVGAFRAGDSRSISRGFTLIDHEADGYGAFITITGGKLTTCRLMAEKTADMVCGKLGITAPCRTHQVPVGAARGNRWTEPGLSAADNLKKPDNSGAILCDCEMVSTDAVVDIIELMKSQGLQPTLKALAQRSRIGKGSCQGLGCGLRVTSFLYDQGIFRQGTGVENIRDFVENRWKGMNAVISEVTAGQAEYQEAIYAGLFGLEQKSTD